MKKSFTLIELIVVIVILGLLTSIVIPNIGNVKEKAIASMVNSNIRNFQTATDIYFIEHEGDFPTTTFPSIGKPQLIDLNKLYPKYIKTLPKEKDVSQQNYWIDYTGRVWGATVDSPSGVFDSEQQAEWSSQEYVVGYNLYEVKNKATAAVNSGKVFSLKQQIELNGNSNKIQLDKTASESYLISAVDQYGLETAPVSLDYEGKPQGEPILMQEGEFYYEINSEETLYWDDFKTVEEKPVGTKITYSFAVGDNLADLTNFTSDFSKLEPAKNIRIKIKMESYQGKYPSLYDLRVFYHYADEVLLTSKRVAESATKVVDEVKLEPNQYVDKIQLVDSYEKNSKPSASYSYSETGSNYRPINSLSSVPSGSYIQITREHSNGNTDFKNPLVYGTTTPPVVHNASGQSETNPAPVDKELQDKGWETFQTITLFASAGDGQITHWIGADIVDNQPENTRILYRYATSNGFGFGPSTDSFGKLSDSRMLKVSVYLQVKKEFKDQSERPSVTSIKINHSRGVANLDLVKPTGSIFVTKSNNAKTENISVESILDWSYDSFDPQGKKIIEAQWGGDKRDQYTTSGTYTVTLKLRNELNYWSDTITYKFDVKAEKPVAVLKPERNQFSSRNPIQWDTTASYDPDGDGIKKVEWGGDATSNHVYAPGSHTIKMRVQDNEGYWSDWISKTFDTVDSVFYNTDSKVLDSNLDTSFVLQRFGVMKILWDEDLTNRIVDFTWRNTSVNINPGLVIRDVNGNILPFINAANGQRVNAVYTSTTKTTSSFIIPKNAYSINIDMGNIESQYSTSVFDISLRKETAFPNKVSNLVITPNHTNIEFGWDSDQTIEKVHFYRNGTHVGTSTTLTFKDTPLLSDTLYNYDIVSVHSNGNVSILSKEVKTTRPYVIFSGIGAAGTDGDLNTSITLKRWGILQVTWDKDLTNQVVDFTWRNSSVNVNPPLLIKDINGNNLSFIDNNTGKVVTKMNVKTTKTTSSFVIPKNAHSIYINLGNIESQYSTYIFEVSLKNEPVFPN